VNLPNTQKAIDRMADEIFELYRLIALQRSRQPAGPEDLSETEFLTLDVLTREKLLSIGDVQKRIGIVPAQMSRIVRSLDKNGGKGFIECQINASDRRRIDISITSDGKEAYDRFRQARLGSMYAILNILSPDDRDSFMRIMNQLRSAFEKKMLQNVN